MSSSAWEAVYNTRDTRARIDVLPLDDQLGRATIDEALCGYERWAIGAGALIEDRGYRRRTRIPAEPDAD